LSSDWKQVADWADALPEAEGLVDLTAGAAGLVEGEGRVETPRTQPRWKEERR
jgi:hypothetical protein